MIKRASSTLDLSENIFAFIASILIVFMSVSIITEVFSRLLFNISFSWVHELNEYTLLYIPFLTAAWLLRDNEHIVIDLLEDVLSPRVKYVLDILIIFIGIFVSAVLVWYGILATVDYFVNGIRSQTNLHVPKAYVVVIIPLGSFLLLLEFIRSFYRKITDTK